MNALIPERINSKLNKIVTKCFEGNRIADRGMSVLDVKFVMNKTESLLHPKLAHLYPKLADMVSGYQASRNNLTDYGLTPEDITDYNTPLMFFERLLNYMMDLEALVSEALFLSREEDCSTYSFLLTFMRELTPITKQCLILIDKMEFYGDDYQSFDFRVDSFINL